MKHLNLLTFVSWFVRASMALVCCQTFGSLVPTPNGGIPTVYRYDSEIHLLGDFDRDGDVDDWMLIERETGETIFIRGEDAYSIDTDVGFADGYHVLVDSSGAESRLNAGVGDISDASVFAIETTLLGKDITAGFAVCSANHNRTVLTLLNGKGLSDLKGNTASIGRVPYSLSPSGLVAQAPSSSIGGKNDSLLVLCDFYKNENKPSFENLPEPVSSAASVLSSYASSAGDVYRDFYSVFEPDLFFALRENAGGTALLQLRSGPDSDDVALEASYSPLAEGMQMTFGSFSGASDQLDCIFWKKGSNSLTFLRAEKGSFPSSATIFDLGHQPKFVTAAVMAKMFIVVFEDNTAVAYSWSGSGNPLELFDFGSSKNGSFTGAMVHPNGSVDLLEGSAGVSTHIRPFAKRRDGKGFLEQKTIKLPDAPSNHFRGDAATLVTFQGKPLEEDGAYPVEAFRYGDWTDTVGPISNGDTSIKFGVSTFSGGTTGLSSLGEDHEVQTQLPFTDAMINQLSPHTSAYLGTGAVGPVGPSLTVSPGTSSDLTRPVSPVASASPEDAEIFYRLDGAASWSKADHGQLPQIVDDTVVEAYAVSQDGVTGSIYRYSYEFMVSANERDSDGDGVPDAIEAAYGVDDVTSGSDADGDGFTDLVEIDYESSLLEGSLGKTHAISDPNQHPSDGSQSSLDVGGTLMMNVSVSAPLADTTMTATQFVQNKQLSEWDTEDTVSPVTGSLIVQNASDATLGRSTLYPGEVSLVANGVMKDDHQLLLSTDRSMNVLPTARQSSSEHFNSNGGEWLFPDETPAERLLHFNSDNDYYLKVSAAGETRSMVINKLERWVGDYLGDEVGGIRMRVRNLDTENPLYLRVVLNDTITGKFQTSLVSKEAAMMAPAVLDSDSGEIESPWYDVVFYFELPESYTDSNGNAEWDENEPWDDADGDNRYDEGSFHRYGNSGLEFVLHHIGSIQIICNESLATTTAEGHAGFCLDNISLIHPDNTTARMMAAVVPPVFSRPFIPFKPDPNASDYTNIQEWNELRESMWQTRVAMDVDMDINSTLTYLLYEYALELALERMGEDSKTKERCLGHFRSEEEVTAITASDNTLKANDPDNNPDKSGVEFKIEGEDSTNKEISIVRYPRIDASTGSFQIVDKIYYPFYIHEKGELERATADDVSLFYDVALEGEYFILRRQNGDVYRGIFGQEVFLEYVNSASSLTAEEIVWLYFPSLEGQYAPTSNHMNLAVDPSAMLERIKSNVELNEAKKGALHLAVKTMYHLNGAFASHAPEAFDDPVRAIRYLIRNGSPEMQALGGPSVVGCPRWRAAFAAMGHHQGFWDTAFEEANNIISSSLGTRPLVIAESMEIVNGEAQAWERIRDLNGVNVTLVDTEGELFPLPESVPLSANTQFDVTGFEIEDESRVGRVIEVISINLTYLPRAKVVDQDGDLLDDRWEITFHGNLNAKGFEDTDGDGFLDIEEFIYGTDPASKGDSPGANGKKLRLSLRIENAEEDGKIRLRMPMDDVFLNEFTYSVEGSDDLQHWVLQFTDQLSYENGEVIAVVDIDDLSSSQFYRVLLNLQ